MGFVNPEIANLGIDPISPSAPAGGPVSYDPQFEQLSAEIAKIGSLTGAVVDWDAVVQLSRSLLKSKAKDLRIAAYLTAGLLQRNGYEGLLNGLQACANLIRNFWETAYPEKSRMRGRVGAVEWLADRFVAASKIGNLRAPSDELALELEQVAGGFEATLQEFFGNEAPAFGEMLAAVRGHAQAVRDRARAAEDAQKERERQAAAVESGEVAVSSDADKVMEDCATKLLGVARFLRELDLASPLPYRISRTIVWSWRIEAPPQNEGLTYMPAVAPEVRQRLDGWAAQKSWLEIVSDAEASFGEMFFWLDLQRYTVQALTELGEKFSAARETVLTELALFVRRIPEIVTLKFNDGTPFASPQTRLWIETEVAPILSGGGNENQAPAVGESAELAEAGGEARRHAAAGDLPRAIGIFKVGIARASHRRSRFLWRLELAKLCLEVGKPQLALPQLTSLDQDVARFALEEWEPELCLAVVQNLFECRKRLAGDGHERGPDAEHQLGELFERLCRLDANVALAVQT